MSCFMLYFEGQALPLLGGNRGQIFFYAGETEIVAGSKTLSTSGLSISYEWSGGVFRGEFDLALHRELFRFLAGRLAAGKSPHLVFHWFHGSEGRIEVGDLVEVSIRDVEHLCEILQNTPDDRVLRVTEILHPPTISLGELLVEKLDEGQVPCVDGVLFGDTSLVLMESEVDPETRGARVRPLARSTLASYLDYNQNQWYSVVPLASCLDEAEGLRLSCGEGAPDGSESIPEGFVAVRRAADGGLLWLAFFHNSTAFREISLEGGEVLVTAASGARWHFPLAQPELVRITGPIKATTVAG